MIWIYALHGVLDGVSAIALYMLASIYVDRHASVPTAWHFFASAAFAMGATAEVVHLVLTIVAAKDTAMWAPGAWYVGMAVKAVMLGFGFGASWMLMRRSVLSRLAMSVGMIAAACVVAWAATTEFLLPGTGDMVHTLANIFLIGLWLLLAILAMRLPMMRALSPVGLVEFCVMMALAHVVMSMTSKTALDLGFIAAHIIKVAGYGPLLRLFFVAPGDDASIPIDPSFERAVSRLESLGGSHAR